MPAAAVYGVGMPRAVAISYVAWRKTFGADIVSWSALWVVSGVAALAAAIPDAFDLYGSGPGGSRFGGLVPVIMVLVVLPLTLTAQALAGAFVATILSALRHGQAPPGLPTSAVETVSGLRLDG